MKTGHNAESLGLTGEEVYDIPGLRAMLESKFANGRKLTVKAKTADGKAKEFSAMVRIDTPQEILYYQHGGILLYVLRQLAGQGVGKFCCITMTKEPGAVRAFLLLPVTPLPLYCKGICFYFPDATPANIARRSADISLAESKGHRWHLRRITSGRFLDSRDRWAALCRDQFCRSVSHFRAAVGEDRPTRGVCRPGMHGWAQRLAMATGAFGFSLSSADLFLAWDLRGNICTLASRVSLKKYFLRRVTRLEPPYILNLVFCALVAFFYYHQTLGYMVPHLLASVLYQHNLAYHTPSVINGVTWSLEVEIQFYILAPLIALLFRISNATARRSIFLVLIAVCGILQLLSHANATVAAFDHRFLHAVFPGGDAADRLVPDVRPHTRIHWAWDILSLCGWPVVFSCVSRNFLWFHAILPFLIMLLIHRAFQGVIFRKFFSNFWIAIIGGMCYSIYLWHFFTIGVFFKLTRHLIVFHDFLLNFVCAGDCIRNSHCRGQPAGLCAGGEAVHGSCVAAEALAMLTGRAATQPSAQ